MPTETAPPARKDRRRETSIPQGLVVYTPGIQRLERVRDRAFEAHNRIFRDYDEESWQVAYDLLNHNTRVGSVCSAIAQATAPHFRWSQEDVNVVIFAGGSHDTGKMDPTCWKYRRVDIFSPEERRELTLRHQMISHRFTMNLKSLVRAEDRPFLVKAGLIVRYHHNDPHEIPHPSLVAKCMVVKMADIFITVQEDRKYQKAKSEWDAVRIVRGVVEDWSHDPRFAPYIHTAEVIRDAVAELYGPENVGLKG